MNHTVTALLGFGRHNVQFEIASLAHVDVEMCHLLRIHPSILYIDNKSCLIGSGMNNEHVQKTGDHMCSR